MNTDDWARMWKISSERYDKLCIDIMQTIADGKSLDNVLDIVGDSMNNCDAVDDESIALFDKAKSVASRTITMVQGPHLKCLCDDTSGNCPCDDQHEVQA